MTPAFRKRLRREIKLRLREMRDGCVDCLTMPKNGFCPKHEQEGLDLVRHPKRQINLKQREKP